MTASISDVATHAGVSVATVSRALRGLPNVAESTRERVMKAAAELDYVVNPNASRLAAGHNHTIGVVVPHTTGWYFQQVLTGVQDVLSDSGYDMLLYTVPTPESRERFLTMLPFRKRVDGLVLIDLPLTDPEQRMLAGLGTTAVSVGEGGPHMPRVAIDNVRAARLATDYLLDLGHRRIGLISGPTDDPMRFRVTPDRHEGWASALRERKIESEPSWVVTGDFRMDGGAEAMGTLLGQSAGLTAVLCMSDEMAIGALGVLKDLGIAVPGDLSVIGFDGHEVGHHLGLTTIEQPMLGLGMTAAEVLVKTVRGEAPTGFPWIMPATLRIRDTTAAAPWPWTC